MVGPIVDWLAALHGYAGAIAWLVLAAFAAGALVERYDERLGTRVYAVAWVTLAGFWLAHVEYFVLTQKSITESVGVVLATPLSLYVAVLLWHGRDRLLVVSRAIAFAWLFYLPLSSLSVVRRPLIETVTAHTDFFLSALGDDYQLGAWYPTLPNGAELPKKRFPYRNTFLYHYEGRPITYTIRLACTGIGSMAIFVGLIGAVRGSLRNKAKALGVAVVVIYVLNIARNVFIAHTLGNQRLHVFPEVIMALFASDDPHMVSFFVGDRIISQFASVIALIAIVWLVIRWVPDVLRVIEEGLYVLTRREFDLRGTLAGDAGDREGE